MQENPAGTGTPAKDQSSPRQRTWTVIGTTEERRRWFNDEQLTVDLAGIATRTRHEHDRTVIDIYRSVDRTTATSIEHQTGHVIDAGETPMRTHYQNVADGNTITFRPRGHSMTPTIKDREEVTVAPADSTTLAAGDIVLVKVSGRIYLHYIDAVDADRVRIANAKGHINGWTRRTNAVGIVTHINNTPVGNSHQR